MVEILNHKPKIEGPNPTNGTGREKNVIFIKLIGCVNSSTVVENLTDYLMIEGSNPSTVTWRKKHQHCISQ